MTDEAGEADLRAGDPRAETASDQSSDHAKDDGADTGPEKGPVKGRTGSGRGGLTEHTRSRLAVQLRAMYDTVAQQPVPDRFADLIARLDERAHEKD